jgi:serine/threonine protein kinase
LVGWNVFPHNNPAELWFLTDFKAKGSLKIESVSRYSLIERWMILYGIPSGMKHLHSRKIMDRDLKPENILLDANLYPVIADFGLATPADDLERSVRAGTAIYISPEVWKGTNYSLKTDVYSYAILFYEIFEGMAYTLPNWVTLIEDKAAVMDRNCRPVFQTITGRLVQFVALIWADDEMARPIFD